MANIITGNVKEVQQMLNDLGYDTGGVDGVIGSKTAQAITDYQISKGGDLNVDGIVGDNTYSSLLNDTSNSNSDYSPTGLGPGGGDGTGNGSDYYDYSSDDRSLYVSRNPFSTSTDTDNWKYLLDSATENTVGDYSESKAVQDKKKKLEEVIASQPAGYEESDAVKQAKEELAKIESNKPAEFKSQYSDQISTILDGILNRKSFDVTNDSNYTYLYNLAKQNAMQNGDRAMRDTMGSAQAQTGGYGSTYSQQVGQQAYDNYLQSLNDNNTNLMSLAKSIYDTDTTNQYNKLSALNSQDSIDYGRYRDNVGDWQADRSYYANRADTAYNQDYGQYRDTVTDWQADRSYYDNAYNNERNFDYGQYQDRVAQQNTDRAFYGDMYNNSYANDLTQYQYDTNYDYNAGNNLYDRAMQFASQGIEVPSSYYGSLSEDEIAAINNVATKSKAGTSAGSPNGSNEPAVEESEYADNVNVHGVQKKKETTAQGDNETMINVSGLGVLPKSQIRQMVATGEVIEVVNNRDANGKITEVTYVRA